MFVSPISDKVFERQKDNEFHIIVNVNVIWESVGSCLEPVIGICVFGAFGDQAFIDFKIDRNKKIVNWRWFFIQYPKFYPTFDELKSMYITIDSQQAIKVRKYPSLYEHCSFSGAFMVLGSGWFNIDWIKYWDFIQLDSTSQNGVMSFSSIDTAGCWTVTLWNGKNWNGNVKTFTNTKEECFKDNLGWLNDRTQSVASFPSYTCRD